MNPKLRALLIVLATGLGAAGAITLFTWPSGMERAVLLDAGIRDDCVLKDVQCSVRLRTGEYGERIFPVAVCTEGDGGIDVIVPPRVAANVTRLEYCRRYGTVCTTCDGGTLGAVEPTDGIPTAALCACRRPDAGLCRFRLNDGGLRLAPIGSELQPGTFQGPGCFPKSCGEFAGEQGSSWPAECPQ